MNLRRRLCGRAHDRDALRQHDLVAAVRMQIARAHEARLGWVGVDPTENHEVMLVAIVEEGALVDRLACVGRRLLLGNYEPADEEGVGDERAAEDAACLEVALRVWGGDVKEALTEVWGKK